MGVTRLFDILAHQSKNHPIEKSLVTKKNGIWEETSTESLISQVNQVSRGLLKYGIKPGDKIAVITNVNRTEWLIIDYAVQQVGAVTVPIYPTLSKEDFKYVLNDSKSIFCFVSDKELYDKIQNIREDCAELVSIFTFDEVEGATCWTAISDMGEDDSTQYEVDSLKDMAQPEDLVTLIYTSGTTGRPKGVMLTHKNIVSNVLNSHERVLMEHDKNFRVLSFLPICHVLERMVTYIFMYRSYSIFFAESIEKLALNLKEVKPHIITAVPRVVEKLYTAIYSKGTSGGWLKSQIFLWSLKVAEKFEPFQPAGFKQKLADMLVYRKWREGLGGDIRLIVCGSAALSGKLNRIFFAAGLPIMEGYGLTETSPVIAVNGNDKSLFRFGTVGPLIKESQVKIAEDGEILTQGPNVFIGYYNQEEKTKESFTEDGWFKTGDIGFMEDGFLTITDRKKEIFKTSGGKYITPQITENFLKQSRFIEQAMVVGDGEKMPCALIQPDFKFIKEYIKFKHLPISTSGSQEEIIQNESIQNRIMKEVEKVNELLGHWEQIKKIELTPQTWSVEGGELTPTLKLRRKIIKEKYIDLYNKMYQE
ncbi:long-chain fatty acid--CoA ligase [Apibacter sp. HY039]|uniref:AMP-dependent synthetase/ligase n=1 Tax=Apibacter sp. HY039 TaxID=2501476 RepID=UPI000FEC1573|nr:long-chain fatty acid--CoA ligase [Apibacter sp. HY039]